MAKINLCGLTIDEIFGIIQPGGFNWSHANTVARLLYKKGFSENTKATGLSRKLKEYLTANTDSGLYPPFSSTLSSDGTVKFIFRIPDGSHIETVLIVEGKRTTVCVSTQSGCRMACPFCMTGRYGFYGHLSAGDILNQLISLPHSDRITHVVFMGMGEPMDNLENVMKAINVIIAEWGLAIGKKNVTVSTVGITGRVREYLERSRCNLTLSLYSPFSDERAQVIPMEKPYPVAEIIDIMKSSCPDGKRRLSIAYIMIDGVNDTERHLEELISLLKGSRVHVNLLSYHSIPGDYNTSSSDARILYFKHNLVVSGISASIRKSRGADISAACGLLASGLNEIRVQ